VSGPIAPLVVSFDGAPAPICPLHYIQLDLRCEGSGGGSGRRAFAAGPAVVTLELN
jgi:hypothetical protein